MCMRTKIYQFSCILNMLRKKWKVLCTETAKRREQIQAPPRALKVGEAIRKAAKPYGVSNSTLRGYVTGEPNTCNTKWFNKHLNISQLFYASKKLLT